ncbi:MAG: TraX family protein [Ruthenibacterium sp.]
MEQTKLQPRGGLTGFHLKYLALFLMVLDHIHYFFGFTGKIPVWFSMLGRLSAPLFLFCVVEGFIHTHDRRRYFLRLYAIAVGMGILQYIFIVSSWKRPDGFYPQNQIFANFVILLVILQGLDWCAQKHWCKGLAAVLLPLAWPYLVLLASMLIPALNPWVGLVHYTLLPMHSAIADGGTVYILLGVLLYVLRGHRKVQAAAFFAATMLFYGVLVFWTVPGITLMQMFTEAYEWMGAFAAIPMLLYNGERGHGSKSFFYWFYPAHVYILFALSWGLYLILHR